MSECVAVDVVEIVCEAYCDLKPAISRVSFDKLCVYESYCTCAIWLVLQFS